MPTQRSVTPFCNYSNQLFNTLYKTLNIRGEGHRQSILLRSLCSREIQLFLAKNKYAFKAYLMFGGEKEEKVTEVTVFELCALMGIFLYVSREGSDS